MPIDNLYTETDSYLGAVFEEQFKFFQIFHGEEDADPAKRMQVIKGKAHFQARPMVSQINVICIRITPRQEQAIIALGIHRQDMIKARVCFVGLSPNKNLAFELLEILCNAACGSLSGAVID